MKDNLSIDEIIRQAEEIRQKAVDKTQNAIESNNKIDKNAVQKTVEIPKQNVNDDVKEYKKSKAESALDSQKTTVVNIDSQKTQAVNTLEKTNVVPSLDKANETKKKKSFFDSANAYEPLYSKQPPDIIEKSATIKSRSKFDKTLDLQEIPTIVAVEELEKTKINFAQNENSTAQSNLVPEEGYQIVLEGFEDSTDEIVKIDEEVAEQQLMERRKDKVNKFRLFSPEDLEDSSSDDGIIEDDYHCADEKALLLSRLEKASKTEKKIALVTGILSILLGALAFFKDSAYLPSFLLDNVAYLIAVIVIFFVVMIVNAKTFIHGFKLKSGINYSFPVSILSLVVLAHTIFLIVDSDLLVSGDAYPLACSFAFLALSLGKYTMLTRMITNLDFISNRKQLYSVETIINQVDATIISRGLLTGEANLKTSIKTDSTSKFFEISKGSDPASVIAKTTGVAMMILSLISFFVFSYISKSWYVGLNIAVCAFCISIPCASLYTLNNALLGVSKQLNKKGAMVNGFEGAEIVENTNAIVLEAQDLFSSRSCQIHGIKTFNGAKADDVILKTAAVIINTKSPLASVFDDVIIGKQTILPDVDGLVYEDKMGTSAWIYRKKILVGTREMLIHHGVTVPKEEYEQKYKRKGRKILYLADTGKLTAMFVVSYHADPQLKKSLRKLEKSGMTILVKSGDPFINDESIAELFSLPDGYVRVMNSSNGRAFEKYSDMCVEKSPAYIVHNGTALGFVSAMSAAENLQETKKLLSVLISFGCAIGFGVVMLLGAVGGASQLSAVSVSSFQIIWCIFVELIAKLKRLT